MCFNTLTKLSDAARMRDETDDLPRARDIFVISGCNSVVGTASWSTDEVNALEFIHGVQVIHG
ncbi:hypothetical protein C0995_014324, partial [Termitomyces sp. Mi166